ncbi:MAG: isoprenylcysteine carboxylmethyltransferase family protein [Bryobacterales bacterium]|nr:isoprenylcysteine carboxylmethyltransferase family protein [Bryobacteraceae bacterium]MDW8353729.1 isoprenylcysteine carboxylmethyltransferase family protein [Bryobacterales bacterium]
MTPTVARVVVLVCWTLMGVVAVASYVGAARRRRRTGLDQRPAQRSSVSLWGLAMEAAAFGLIWSLPRSDTGPEILGWMAAGLAVAAAGLFVWAVRTLGVHFRIQAVVTHDHQLVTCGPYRFLRHPIYASLLWMLLSNSLLVTRWEAAVGALALFVVGTEIRVRVEERLLAVCLPEEFAAYRRRLPAYIPFLR